jgi:hypothetical protein
VQVSTIGVDLAKNVFQVHGVDSAHCGHREAQHAEEQWRDVLR